MIEGKTKSGFKFKVDERIGTDWRLMEAIALSESDDASKKIKGSLDLINLILGKDAEKLKTHIAKNNDGFIPAEVMNAEVLEIINSLKEIKN